MTKDFGKTVDELTGGDNAWTPDQVAAILHNPVYTGVGPFPRIVSDEQWLTVATKLAKKEGVHKYLSRMLKELRAALEENGDE